MDKVCLYIITAAAVSSLPAPSFYFVYELKNWTEAQSYCRKYYKDLATIDSMEDVHILDNMKDLSKMIYPTNSYRAWIGLYDDVNSWRWSMSDPNFYQQNEAAFRNWYPGEPNNSGGRESCGGIFYDGTWNDASCSTNIKPVCFDVKGPDVTFVLINTMMNWTEAQRYCREHHTDLASVRNQAENQKVKELIPAGQSIWIGLYRDTWKWSDGRSSSFRNWRSGEPDNNMKRESCAAVNLEASGDWADWTCDVKRAFICYSVLLPVLKLELIKVSSVDLNVPAVLQDLLRKLIQKLKDGGVDADITLRWKTPSDGNVFSKKTEGKEVE